MMMQRVGDSAVLLRYILFRNTNCPHGSLISHLFSQLSYVPTEMLQVFMLLFVMSTVEQKGVLCQCLWEK